ncbi:hypothetical protein ERJ75_000841700 [Trypanosoma vivax]|nr:hypothetical protein ERJ75_000841700 [Trypanosoma vivax]
MEDALREARLQLVNAVAHRRASEYELRLKGSGPVHAKVQDSVFPLEHPIHIRLAKAQDLFSTIDSPEKDQEAAMLRLARRVHFRRPTARGLKADAPEKDRQVHTIGRVRRFSGFDCQV